MTTPKRGAVHFNRRSIDPTETKQLARMKSLEGIVDWSPRRTGKEETISPKMMKKIWKNGSE